MSMEARKHGMVIRSEAIVNPVGVSGDGRRQACEYVVEASARPECRARVILQRRQPVILKDAEQRAGSAPCVQISANDQRRVLRERTEKRRRLSIASRGGSQPEPPLAGAVLQMHVDEVDRPRKTR